MVLEAGPRDQCLALIPNASGGGRQEDRETRIATTAGSTANKGTPRTMV